MVLGKAARGEMSGLWRVEVPCALPFVRAARQPSVFMRISVCGPSHMCVGTAEKGSAAKTVRKIRPPKAERRETNKQIKAAVLTPWGCTSLFILPWPFCFLLQNRPENRDSVWCQSKGKHPLFKSREERMYRLYWGRAIPSRVGRKKKPVQTWMLWIQGANSGVVLVSEGTFTEKRPARQHRVVGFHWLGETYCSRIVCAQCRESGTKVKKKAGQRDILPSTKRWQLKKKSFDDALWETGLNLILAFLSWLFLY